MIGRNDDVRDRKQRNTGGGTALTKTPGIFKGTWAYASIDEYNRLLMWYRDWHGVYRNSETGETYDPYYRILDNAGKDELRELSKKEHQALLKEMRTRIYPEPPILSDIYINLETLQTYDPSTRALSFIDAPAETRVLSEEEHSTLLCEICVDVVLASYEEKETSSIIGQVSDRGTDAVVNQLLKRIKLGSRESIFLAHLKHDAPGAKLARFLELGYTARLRQIITGLEQGKFGVRWQTLNWDQKGIIVARIALALRLAGNYLLKDELLLWEEKVLPGAVLLGLSTSEELASIQSLENAKPDFDPTRDDISQYFMSEDGEGDYLIIHGSFIFGPESEQPGDIDLILSLLEGSRAGREIPYASVIGKLEEDFVAEYFAKSYRINNLHPDNLGSEMDLYLGIPLWGKKEIGTTIYEEWETILPDFQRLGEKVLDKGHNDSHSKRARKLVDLAVICHHFLLWMNADFDVESFDNTFQEHIERVRALIDRGNATLLSGSFSLSWTNLSAKLEEIRQVEAYITRFLRLVRKTARKHRKMRR